MGAFVPVGVRIDALLPQLSELLEPLFHQSVYRRVQVQFLPLGAIHKERMARAILSLEYEQGLRFRVPGPRGQAQQDATRWI